MWEMDAKTLPQSHCQVELDVLDVLRQDNRKTINHPVPRLGWLVIHENHQMRSSQETQ